MANNCSEKLQSTLNNFLNKKNDINNQNNYKSFNQRGVFRNDHSMMNLEEQEPSNYQNNFERTKNNDEGQKKDFKCWKCGEQGHFANDCPTQNNNNNNRGMSNNNMKNRNQNNQNGNQNNRFNNNNTMNNFDQNNRFNNHNSMNNFDQNNRFNKNNTMNNFDQNNRFNNNNTMNNFDRKGIICFKCNQEGHYASSCTLNLGTQNTFSNNNFDNNRKNQNQSNFQNQNRPENSIVCFKCNEPGHISTNCPGNGKRNFNQMKNGKKQRERKGCETCGMLKHPKNSTCAGIKKRKKKNQNQDEYDYNEEEG